MQVSSPRELVFQSPPVEEVRQLKIPLPIKGERQGEGVGIQALTPSPRPSPSRETVLSDASESSPWASESFSAPCDEVAAQRY